ncbi:MAG: Cna B-type domain-containing protein [Oscillospiraceae bacterium]|nr:Cna B-type domain-containing protein [Oscillospiraceae bacterium]
MKKILAVLLSLVMVLSLLGPAAAALEEDTVRTEPTEAAVVAAEEEPVPAENEETVTAEQPAAEETGEATVETAIEAPAEAEAPEAEEPAQVPAEEEMEAVTPEEEVAAEETVPAEEETAEEEEPAEEPEEEPAPVVIPTEFVKELDNVTVTAATESGAFQVPVELQVTPLEEGSDAYNKADEKLSREGYAYDGMLAFDIGFVDESGASVEPDGEVYVSLKLKPGGVVPENAETALVAHITDDGVEPVADTAGLTPGAVTLAAGALNADFVVDSFSTFTITWTVEGEEMTATIHFVEINEDGTVTDLESEVSLDTSAASVSLNTDFPDVGGKEYRFVGGYYATEAVTHPADDAVNINATLTKAEDGTWTCTPVDGSAAITIASGSHLYATYKQFVPAGTTPETGDASLIKPDSIKNVTDNGDGTYTIRLDINGHQHQEKQGANVLLVFDRTSSMVDNNMGSVTRFAAAKSAVHTLVDALDPAKNPITMAAMSFARTADANYVNWTGSGSAITGFTDGLAAAPSGATPGSGGTNWEAAFDMAKTIINGLPAANRTNPTYLVFLTDGNPTIYVGSNTINQANQNSAEYTRARTSASGVNSAIPIYGILCANANDGPLFNTLMTQLATAAYGSHETHYVLADNESTLTSTFQEIGNKILADLGASQASTNDGVTSLSATSATAGAAGAFKYYKTARPEGMEDDQIIPQSQLVPWDKAPAASYSSSTGVTWDLESVGVLEDNTSYTLEFTVWPSQAAYDLIADLNNGLKSYDSLDDATKAQVYESGGKYYLRTNTNFDTTYSFQNEQYKDPGTTQSEGSMLLPTETISVEKIWNNLLDQKEPPQSATLYLMKGDEEYLVGDNAIVVSAATDWKAEVYISLGQIQQDKTDNSYTVLETGHDYTITESAESSYRWELTSDIFRPMVINGEVVMLIKDDSVTGTDGVDYYTIDGSKYKPAEGSNNLRAWNDRRSWLQIEKKVTGDGADPDAMFEFTVTVTDANGDDVWFSVYDPTAETNPVKGLTTNATPEEGDTGYYYAASGTAITVEIKAGWTLRFTNLPSGSTYEIEETTLPDGFRFVQAEDRQVVDTQADQDDPERPTISEATVTGTINVPNVEFYVDYTNKYEETEIEITKVWEDNDDQIGSRPTAEEYKENVALLVNGEASADYDDKLTITDNGDGTYTVKYAGLPKYIDNKEATYQVQETPVPEGYTASTEDPVADGGQITNTLKVGSLTISKTVESELDEDKSAKFTFTVTLSDTTISGTFGDMTFTNGVATFELTDGQSAIATGLPAGVTYEVVEEPSDAYETTKTGDSGTIEKDGTAAAQFTNARKMIDVTITKVWVDEDNKYGVRPDDVTVELYADEEVYRSDAIAETDKWTVTYTVPEYTTEGEKITYSADEQQVKAGYVKTVEGDAAEGFTITNKFEPLFADPPVGKAIDGEPRKDETFTFKMVGSSTTDTVPMPEGAEGTEMTMEIVGAGADEFGEFALVEPGTYTYVISEVPGSTEGYNEGYTYDDTVYTVEFVVTTAEDNSLVMTTKVNGEEVKELTAQYVTFTNRFEEPTVDISGTKTWNDADDQDGKRPESITINLLADGEKVDSVTVTEADGWKFEFKGVPKYNEDFEEIVYTITEETVDGYETEITDFDVTNTHDPEKVDVSIAKVWDDNDDQDGKRPESLTVTLSNGDKVTLNEENEWKATIEGLPRFEKGEEIKYTWTEASVDGYELTDTTVEEYLTTLTNTHTPEVTKVEVTKVWTDADDKDGIRPDSVTINLLADGKETGASVTLNKDNSWKGTFINLPKYADGKEIEYTISEVAVEGYTTTISGSAASGFTVTNVHVPDDTPSTGDSNLLGLWTALLSVSALGIGAVLKPRRKKD